MLGVLGRLGVLGFYRGAAVVQSAKVCLHAQTRPSIVFLVFLVFLVARSTRELAFLYLLRCVGVDFAAHTELYG